VPFLTLRPCPLSLMSPPVTLSLKNPLHFNRIPRCFQLKCPLLPNHFGRTFDSHLRRPAREIILILFQRLSVISHTAIQFGFNTRECCFRRRRAVPLAIPTFQLLLFSHREPLCSRQFPCSAALKCCIFVTVCGS